MGYKTYPEYRDSGVQWLGEVPAHWETRRLKYAALLRNIKVVAGESHLPYVGLENIESWSGKYLVQDEANDSEGLSSLFYPGDVLFGKLRPYLAKAFLANFEGACSSELLVLQGKGVQPEFLVRFVLSVGFIREVDSSTYGTKMPRASWDFIGNLLVTLPPTEEQTTIAAFLDEKTTQIDQLIEKKTRFIELLKEKRAALITEAVTGKFDVRTGKPYAEYKDSGVAWLGEIPKDWRMVKLRWLSDIQTGLALNNTVDSVDPVGLPYLRVANVQDGYIDLDEIKVVSVERSKVCQHLLHRGDVLMNEGGDNDKLGRGAVWQGEIDPCIHQNHVFAVRPGRELRPDWLAFVTQSHIAKYHFFIHSKQSTNLASISSSNIKELPIPLPPPRAQEFIYCSLFKWLEKMESLMARVQQSIDLLKEKRAALITAAVTGKIDVRNWNTESA